MIVTDLFRSRAILEAAPAVAVKPTAIPGKLQSPINIGLLNPDTGRPYLPSEIGAWAKQRELENARKTAQAAAAQAAQNEINGVKPTTATPDPAAGAFGAMAQQLEKPAPTVPSGTTTVPALTSAPAAVKPPAAKPEPVSIGGQTINPSDPLYARIMQNAPAGPAATNAAPDLTSAERVAVKDIAIRASDMLKTVQTKDDLAKVKDFIDREFAKQGNKYMSEAMFFNRDRLMEQATRIFHRRIS